MTLRHLLGWHEGHIAERRRYAWVSCRGNTNLQAPADGYGNAAICVRSWPGDPDLAHGEPAASSPEHAPRTPRPPITNPGASVHLVLMAVVVLLVVAVASAAIAAVLVTRKAARALRGGVPFGPHPGLRAGRRHPHHAASPGPPRRASPGGGRAAPRPPPLPGRHRSVTRRRLWPARPPSRLGAPAGTGDRHPRPSARRAPARAGHRSHVGSAHHPSPAGGGSHHCWRRTTIRLPSSRQRARYNRLERPDRRHPGRDPRR